MDNSFLRQVEQQQHSIYAAAVREHPSYSSPSLFQPPFPRNSRTNWRESKSDPSPILDSRVNAEISQTTKRHRSPSKKSHRFCQVDQETADCAKTLGEILVPSSLAVKYCRRVCTPLLRYSAVCVSERALTSEDFINLDAVVELQLQQKTPIRVLHR